MWRMEAEELDVEDEESAGTYWPFSRKDLMFDMRRSEDAEGESRMMGSGRLLGAAFGLCGRVVLFAGFAACAFLALNGAASLRTWEKSCIVLSGQKLVRNDIETNRRLNSPQHTIPITHLSFPIVDFCQPRIDRPYLSSSTTRDWRNTS